VEPFSFNQSNLTSHDEQEAPGALDQKQTQNNTNKIRVITKIFASAISVANTGKKQRPLRGQTERQTSRTVRSNPSPLFGGWPCARNWFPPPPLSELKSRM
jgi:hypothetical protein